MVMPADVLLCETRARCAVNGFLDPEPEPASVRSRNSRVHASRGLLAVDPTRQRKSNFGERIPVASAEETCPAVL